MAHGGQRLEDPVTGERLVFRQTSADTEGALLELDMFWPPGFDRREAHVHPEMEERFEVLSGTARFRLGSRERREVIAPPGGVVAVAPGVPHVSSNAGGETVHVRVRFRPALRQEMLLESLYGADSRDGARDGLPPGVLRRALLAHVYRREVRPVRPPLVVQRVVFPILALAARLAGHRV